MNTIIFILLILILTLTLFLANVNTNVTEGYENANTTPNSTKSIFDTDYRDVNTPKPTRDKFHTDYDRNPTYKFDKYVDEYRSDYTSINDYRDSSGNWSKTLGNVTYNEPGSLRFSSSGYVPNYEESIFLSPVTGLRYNQPMYIESVKDVGFCEFNKNSVDKIEEQCKKLDKNVCASTGCCVLLGGSKCVAGNINGPALKSNYGDTFIRNKDQYYHQGKCYGNCSKTDNSITNYDYDFTPTPTSSSSQTNFTPTPTSSSSQINFTPTPTSSQTPIPTS